MHYIKELSTWIERQYVAMVSRPFKRFGGGCRLLCLSSPFPCLLPAAGWLLAAVAAPPSCCWVLVLPLSSLVWRAWAARVRVLVGVRVVFPIGSAHLVSPS